MSYLGLVFTALIWGGGFIAVKDSVETIPSLYILALRFSIAAVGLGVIFIKKMLAVTKQEILSGLILGIFLFISFWLQTTGAKYTTAGKSAFLTAIYVIIVPFLYWAIWRIKLDAYGAIATVLALAGIAILTLDGNISGVNKGDILTLISGFGYAFHIVFVDKFSKKQDPIRLAVMQLAVTAIISWIFALSLEGIISFELLTTSDLKNIAYLGLISTMIAYLLQNTCQRHAAPSMTSLILSLEAVFGVILSTLILKEVLTAKMIIGCLLIFIGIVISETKLKFFRKTEKDNILRSQS